MHERYPLMPFLPFIPGHEGVGYVAGIGHGVKGFKEGDSVSVPWLHDACGGCEHCITGWETLCETQHNTGYGCDGAYADYVLGDANYVGRLPDHTHFNMCGRIARHIKRSEIAKTGFADQKRRFSADCSCG